MCPTRAAEKRLCEWLACAVAGCSRLRGWMAAALCVNGGRGVHVQSVHTRTNRSNTAQSSDGGVEATHTLTHSTADMWGGCAASRTNTQWGNIITTIIIIKVMIISKNLTLKQRLMVMICTSHMKDWNAKIRWRTKGAMTQMNYYRPKSLRWTETPVKDTNWTRAQHTRPCYMMHLELCQGLKSQMSGRCECADRSLSFTNCTEWFHINVSQIQSCSQL